MLCFFVLYHKREGLTESRAEPTDREIKGIFVVLTNSAEAYSIFSGRTTGHGLALSVWLSLAALGAVTFGPRQFCRLQVCPSDFCQISSTDPTRTQIGNTVKTWTACVLPNAPKAPMLLLLLLLQRESLVSRWEICFQRPAVGVEGGGGDE